MEKAQMDEVSTVTIDLSQPPAVVVAPPAPPAVPGFTGEPGNFTKDMAALAAELNPAPVAPVVPASVEQAPPTTTESATAPATAPVPDKFKDADGNLDQAKLDKSQAAAEAQIAAINKYLDTQKALRAAEREKSGLKTQAPPIIPPVAPVAPVSPFAAQLEADMAKYGAGAVLERLFEAAKETAKNEVLSDVQADREERKVSKDRRELEDIAKFDKAVLTPEGLDALARIRAERPYLEKLENPTSEAYDIYLAQQVKKARQTGTVLPTPTGLTAKAPPTPVGPAPRAVVQPTGPDLSTQASIDAYVKGLSPEAEAAFWKSKGFRF